MVIVRTHSIATVFKFVLFGSLIYKYHIQIIL